jgi:hypothetical protein
MPWRTSNSGRWIIAKKQVIKSIEKWFASGESIFQPGLILSPSAQSRRFQYRR